MLRVFIKALWLWGSCTEGKGPICLPSSCKPIWQLQYLSKLMNIRSFGLGEE
jgi:hypothetical protein